MLVNKAYRYELKPNKRQLIFLKKHAGCARFAWNWGLAERKRIWEEEERSTNAIELHRKLNQLKKTDLPWMYEVSKCAPQEALRDLDRAFKNFFEGRAEYPKFKKKGIHDSFRLTGTIRVFPRHVQLPRLGKIRVKEDTHKFKGRILSATVSREADRWYVSLAVEVEIPDPAPVEGALFKKTFQVLYGFEQGHLTNSEKKPPGNPGGPVFPLFVLHVCHNLVVAHFDKGFQALP